jgi:two-component system OmpR family sensor kinase
LSLALNQMLGQIETAFAQRTASELAARRSEEAARRSEDVARQSEEAARQSEERMRRFVADASHELRTPLTSIRGFAELTRQRGDGGDADTMRRIEDEAKRMGLLVDDLLLLARLDQQRPLKVEPVDLLPIAADALHNAQAVQPGRNISLKILPDSEAPVVEGDEARLRQVLGNLVSNALHHTPLEAPILVSIGTRDGEAVLEVSDSGPGLTDEQKARVFERFYRADSAGPARPAAPASASRSSPPSSPPTAATSPSPTPPRPEPPSPSTYPSPPLPSPGPVSGVNPGGVGCGAENSGPQPTR